MHNTKWCAFLKKSELKVLIFTDKRITNFTMKYCYMLVRLKRNLPLLKHPRVILSKKSIACQNGNGSKAAKLFSPHIVLSNYPNSSVDILCNWQARLRSIWNIGAERFWLPWELPVLCSRHKPSYKCDWKNLVIKEENKWTMQYYFFSPVPFSVLQWLSAFCQNGRPDSGLWLLSIG